MSLIDSLQYVYDGLRNGYDNPFWWRGRVLEFLVAPIHTRIYPRRKGAIDIVQADWDTLVVLDACRADLFEQVGSIDEFDTYKRVTSRGSTTLEWVEQNFSNGSFGDIVYVTANPYVSLAAGDAFHELIELWVDEFDETLDTVPPSAVVNAALTAHERFPDKRIIVHFMQPHHPFLNNPTVQFDGWNVAEYDEWRSVGGTRGPPSPEQDGYKREPKRSETTDLASNGTAGCGQPNHSNEATREGPESTAETPWEALAKGVVSKETVWDAYEENLHIALDSLDELLETIDGRIVVTSDHGNMVGERTFPIPLRVFGHPVGIRNSALVDVPWAVLERGNRRSIVEGTVASQSGGADDVVEDRLRALGYQ